MANDTLFQPTGGGGAAGSNASDYIKDAFEDISRKATNNNGLSSTITKNPVGFYLNNNDTTQYGVKTLFIKDLVLIEDRTKWINSKPTYEIVWTQNMEGVKGYVYGNVRLLNRNFGTYVSIGDIDDGIAITGVIRQVGWHVNPSSESSASATPLTDGSSGSALNFNSAPSTSQQTGVRKFAVLLHNTTLEDNNLHTYELQADQANLLSVSGVSVYFQNSGSNIEQRPGVTYVDKAKVETTNGATLSLPAFSGRLNGRSSIVKGIDGLYTISSTEIPTIETIGVGSSGTNLVSVTTNTGASLPIGSVVVGIAGTSFYYGKVINQSTDTLTVSPTLSFGLSGALYKFAEFGPTFTIGSSLYTLRQSLDVNDLFGYDAGNGIPFGQTNVSFWSDPESKWRVWGAELSLDSNTNYLTIGFRGNTTSFLQFDGDASALELEFAGEGILNASVHVNGITAWAINEGFTGISRKTVFSAGGKSWQNMVFTPGQSHVGVGIKSINIYDVMQGATLGALSYLDTFVDQVGRGAVQNATLSLLGGIQRHYADELYFQGAWSRGLLKTYTGGVGYFGASTNSKLIAKYYGTGWAVIGTAGSSMAATFDGASIAYDFNTLKSTGTSLAWHTVELSYQAGNTAIITAFDYQRPDQMELVNEQNYNSDERLEKVPTVFKQANTPQSAKDGDLWLQQLVSVVAPTSLWIRFDDLWHEISIASVVDDPLPAGTMYIFGGNSGGVAASANYVKVSLVTNSNAAAIGDMNTDVDALGNTGGGTRTRGITAGGSTNSVVGGGSTAIQYVDYATSTNAASFGTLTVSNRSFHSGCSDSIRFYAIGGRNTANVQLSSTEYVVMGTLSNSTAGGNLTSAASECSATSSKTRALVFMGSATSKSNRIDYFTLATASAAADFGDLTAANDSMNSCSNGVFALIIGGDLAGGNTSGYQRLLIASLGNSSDFGNLSGVRKLGASAGNRFRALMGGGTIDAGTQQQNIDELSYYTGGQASDWGDLTAVYSEQGAISNTHGGL